jgi:ATP-binding cassette, subfamily B, bacterial
MMSEFNVKESLVENRLVGLWRLMAGYRPHYLVAVISVGLAALAQAGIYYLLRYFIDDVLGQDNFGMVPWIAAGFIGLALLQGAFTFTGGRLSAQTSEGIALRLRSYIYNHIQRLTFTYHDRMQTGELLQRATSDVDAVRRFFAEQMIGIGRISLLFLINFAALLLLHVQLALYSVIVIPLVVAISLYFFKKVGEAYEKFQEQEATVSNTLQENLSGVRVVKAFARQEYEREKFEKENFGQFALGRRLVWMHGTFWPITDIMCGMQMLFGFYLGARMAIAGDITVGTYLAYAGLIIHIIWPIRNLGRLITQMSTGLVSYGRVMEIVRQEREALDAGDYISEEIMRGEIHFENVNFAYAGPQNKMVDEPLPVLHDISFSVKPGEIVALLGATGSGKTTLVNLLPRFYDYSSGLITLDGVDLRRYPRTYLRQQIGIVMQEPFLFSRTIRENITYGVDREVSDEEVFAAARAAAVHDVILEFPDGYETRVGERGVTLSGGQKQRVTLARTLLKNPRILILDDATSSVDTETEAEIRQALNGLMQDRTTFIIAHRIQSVMIADQILVLDHGRIVQRGSHEELMAEPGIYRRTFDLQARIEAELEAELATAVSNNGHAKEFYERSA